MTEHRAGPAVPYRALVVDDEEALARLVSGYLERDGFEVAVSTDGPSALGAARELDREAAR